MNIRFRRSHRTHILLTLLLSAGAMRLGAQDAEKQSMSVVSGTICDAQNHPLVGAEVLLENSEPGHVSQATSDSQGHFHFDSVRAGNYTLRARKDGYQPGREGPFVLRPQEVKSIVLCLSKVPSTAAAKESAESIPFSDEPQFTVAGVTDTTALGGHGSARALPSTKALEKDTAALAHGSASSPDISPRSDQKDWASQETSLRAMLAHEERADLHVRLAEIEESEGRPLDAVKDYERAAELQPTEPHLFAWGAELLLHHALEPAIEVFTKGRRLFPQSIRLLLGLGAAKYAQGSREEAAQFFLEASDLAPTDPQPYIFLGRLQTTANTVPPAWTERMKRFATLHPESATAHYLYAVAFIKQGVEPEDSAAIESQLNTAIELDPHFGDAYLQLGILRLEHKDFPGAIAALQKAVENTPLPAEAHYRLADVYRRRGDTEKAHQEIALYKQITEQKNKEADRERHEIQQFVYTLRGQDAPTETPAPNPH